MKKMDRLTAMMLLPVVLAIWIGSVAYLIWFVNDLMTR